MVVTPVTSSRAAWLGYTGPAARVMITPAAAAHSRVSTTPRLATSRSRKAPARTANCHGWESSRASRYADPKIAPIAAGPEPSRNAWGPWFVRIALKCRAPPRMKANDGVNATTEASRPPGRPAAAYPTTATVCTTGPGVTWPSATALRNCALVIQCRPTASACMSGMMTKPPPNDSAPTLNATHAIAPKTAAPTVAPAAVLARRVELGRRERDVRYDLAMSGAAASPANGGAGGLGTVLARRRIASSARPQPSRTSTSHGPTVAHA